MEGRTGGSFNFRYNFVEERERERLLSPRIQGFTKFFGDLEEEHQTRSNGCSAFCLSIKDKFLGIWSDLGFVARKAWEMGKSDPRKIVFSAKMGLALILISLLIYLKMSTLKDISTYSLWAILSVVVAFEFSIGATLSKGLSRGLGAISAGALALGMGELSQLGGDWGVVIAIFGIFVTGLCFTYAKLYPTMKPYKYGFQVFLIMCSFIMASGYHTREFVNTVATQLVLIALGACISLAVNICIYPIWAGDDLHKLVAKHFMSVATSLEVCINGYLQRVEYERIPSRILNFQASDDLVYNGYRSAIESIRQEDALVKFASWEPPHGPYKLFKYPWKNYVKLSGALRHCTVMLMALHGLMLSEIQAPAERRQVFRNEVQRVGVESAKVLRELGSKVKNMEKLGAYDMLYEVHEAAEELQMKVDKKSYLFVNSGSWEISKTNEVVKVQEDYDFLDINDEEYDFLDINDEEYDFQDYDSHGESSMDRESVRLSRSLSDTNFNSNRTDCNSPAGFPLEIMTDRRMTRTYASGEPEIMTKRHLTWTYASREPEIMTDRHLASREPYFVPQEIESKTYESACALSLATFSFLLIEFVARLQNLVETFEELSEKAQFKDPANPQETAAEGGFWNRIRELFKRDGN